MTMMPADIQPPTEPSAARLVLTLTTAGLLSGLAIVSVYEATLPIIERNNERALERAVLEVVPGSASMRGLVLRDGLVREAEAGERAEVFAGLDEAGGFVGYAIPAAGAGFQDVISLIYGFDPARRRIVGMTVLESRETPGLGDKIYKDEAFVSQFASLAVSPRLVCVKPGEREADHEVDAITGATISAKAVVRIIAEANERWVEVLPADGPGLGDGGQSTGDGSGGSDGLEAHPTGDGREGGGG